MQAISTVMQCIRKMVWHVGVHSSPYRANTLTNAAAHLHETAHGVHHLLHRGSLTGLLVPAPRHQTLQGGGDVSDHRGPGTCTQKRVRRNYCWNTPSYSWWDEVFPSATCHELVCSSASVNVFRYRSNRPLVSSTLVSTGAACFNQFNLFKTL